MLGRYGFLQLPQLMSDILCGLCLLEIVADWKDPTVYVRLSESLPRHVLSRQNEGPLHKEVFVEEDSY
jgi:hypothetical protein